jgi:hypothetical protein
MKQFGWRATLVVVVTVIGLLAAQSAAFASSPSVSGGGVVDGALGTTSQLGFNASSSGGQFLCVMAGRSGGVPFGPWASISQMDVKGDVTAGSLEVNGNQAIFSGTATIHVVGKTATGDVLVVTLTGMPYTSTQTEGGATVAHHRLDIPGVGSFAGDLKSGRINVTP